MHMIELKFSLVVVSKKSWKVKRIVNKLKVNIGGSFVFWFWGERVFQGQVCLSK
jgi:hypothetical protein